MISLRYRVWSVIRAGHHERADIMQAAQCTRDQVNNEVRRLRQDGYLTGVMGHFIITPGLIVPEDQRGKRPRRKMIEPRGEYVPQPCALCDCWPMKSPHAPD